MIYVCLLVWLIGVMFTVGFIDDFSRPHNTTAKWMSIIVWSMLLGRIIAEKTEL